MDFLVSFFGQDSCLVWPDSSVADIHHRVGFAVLLFLLLGVSVEKAIPVYPAVYRACYCGFASVSFML